MFAIMIAMASTGWESGLSSSATSVMDFSLQGCSTSVQSSASKKKFFLFDSEALTQHLTLTADALDSLKKGSACKYHSSRTENIWLYNICNLVCFLYE